MHRYVAGLDTRSSGSAHLSVEKPKWGAEQSGGRACSCEGLVSEGRLQP